MRASTAFACRKRPSMLKIARPTGNCSNSGPNSASGRGATGFARLSLAMADHGTARGAGAPPARWGAPFIAVTGSVRLLPQESRDVVLVDAALLERLDRGGAIAADHRGHGVELVVVDRAG